MLQKIPRRLLNTAIVITLGVAVFIIVQTKVSSALEDDKLSMIKQGTANAVSMIKSGKGEVQIHKWHLKAKGGVLETDCTYNVFFADNKFRLFKAWSYLNNDPGLDDTAESLVPAPSKDSYEVAYDGVKLTAHYPNRKTATVGVPSTLALNTIHRDYLTNVAVVGNGVCSLNGTYKEPKFAPLQLVGNEVVDGHECYVVVAKQITQSSEAQNYTQSFAFYVDPNRGFTVPKFQVWLEGGNLAHKVVTYDRTVQLRDYGNGIWGPAKSTTTSYTLSDAGQPIKTMELIADFSSDFKMNVPITEEELTVTLPSGTSVVDKLLDARYNQP